MIYEMAPVATNSFWHPPGLVLYKGVHNTSVQKFSKGVGQQGLLKEADNAASTIPWPHFKKERKKI